MDDLNRLPFGERLRRGEFRSAREARRALDKAKVSDAARADFLVDIARMEAEEVRDEGRERHVLFDIIPDGWFFKYLDFCRNSESPLMFHMMCALAAFSHLVGKRRYFYLPGRNIYAPINVMIVSPAGLARRGEAIEPAVRIAKKAGAKVIQDQATMEGLISSLQSNPHTLFVAEEAATLLSSREYMSDIPQFLCRLLDCPRGAVERHLKSGNVRVKNPTLNVILSTAPSYFAGMPENAVGGGMMSRIIIGYEAGREKAIPFPEDVASERVIRKEEEWLVKELARVIPQDVRKLVYAGRVKNSFKKWYRDVGKELKSVPENMTHWIGRKPAHVHRIVMNFILSQGREDTEVDGEIFDRAVALIKIAEEKMSQAYAHAGKNQHELKRQKIVDGLARIGGTGSKSELFRRVGSQFKDSKEFDDYLGSLVDRGVCFVERVKTATKPKLVVVLRGNER